jgi:hypothetical protein
VDLHVTHRSCMRPYFMGRLSSPAGIGFDSCPTDQISQAPWIKGDLGDLWAAWTCSRASSSFCRWSTRTTTCTTSSCAMRWWQQARCPPTTLLPWPSPPRCATTTALAAGGVLEGALHDGHFACHLGVTISGKTLMLSEPSGA